MRAFIYSVLFLCFFSTGKSQGLWKYAVAHPDSAIQGYDTTMIDPMLNQLTFRYFLNLKQAELRFRPRGLNQEFRFMAGDFARLGLGFGYRWLILNYSYGRDPAVKQGVPGIQSQDLQMNIFGKKWLYDIRAQWYRGFRIDNLLYPDLNVVAFGSSLRYNFNNQQYSFKNTFDQTQWQKKSKGTPIAGINLGYTRISADSSLSVLGQTLLGHPHHENYNAAIGGGYSYTFVFKEHWFITITYTLFADFFFIGSQKNFNRQQQLSTRFMNETRFGFGYNSKKYYFGLQSTSHTLAGQASDDISLTYRYNNIKLLFAHRLNFNPFRHAQ